MTGGKRDIVLARHPLEQLVAAAGRAGSGPAPCSRTSWPAAAASASARRRRAVISHVVAREQLLDAVALPLVVLHHEHAAQALRELGFEPLERLDQLLALHRLERVADRAQLQRLAG